MGVDGIFLKENLDVGIFPNDARREISTSARNGARFALGQEIRKIEAVP